MKIIIGDDYYSGNNDLFENDNCPSNEGECERTANHKSLDPSDYEGFLDSHLNSQNNKEYKLKKECYEEPDFQEEYTRVPNKKINKDFAPAQQNICIILDDDCSQGEKTKNESKYIKRENYFQEEYYNECKESCEEHYEEECHEEEECHQEEYLQGCGCNEEEEYKEPQCCNKEVPIEKKQKFEENQKECYHKEMNSMRIEKGLIKVNVRLNDKCGVIISGAKVNLYSISYLNPKLCSCALTDHEGNAYFSGLDDGNYRVIALVDRRYFKKPIYCTWNEVNIGKDCKRGEVAIVLQLK